MTILFRLANKFYPSQNNQGLQTPCGDISHKQLSWKESRPDHPGWRIDTSLLYGQEMHFI